MTSKRRTELPFAGQNTQQTFLSFFYVLTLLYLKHNKTEILRIGDEHIEKEYIIGDADGNEITSKLKESIKVCGITYSDNEELAYEKTLQIQL